MASDEQYLDYILEQLASLPAGYRPMMGEYLLYYEGKIFGGIYDNRFLLKPTKSLLQSVSNPTKEIPFPGGKPMVLVENPEDSDRLIPLIRQMAEELPCAKSTCHYKYF